MSNHKENMYTDGDYLLRNPTWHSEDSAWKAQEIDRMIRKNNLTPASVADVGCGAGRVLIHLSELHPAVKTWKGFDISPQAIAIAEKSATDKVQFLQADFAEEEFGHFDLLLVIDVIEHLEDYMDFLKKIRHRARHIIFHIPLDLSCRSILKPHVLHQQRRDVGHIHYFSKDMVEWILADTGYHIVDWFYTLPGKDREPARGIIQYLKKIIRTSTFFLSKDLGAKIWGDYSVMILATGNEK